MFTVINVGRFCENGPFTVTFIEFCTHDWRSDLVDQFSWIQITGCGTNWNSIKRQTGKGTLLSHTYKKANLIHSIPTCLCFNHFWLLNDRPDLNVNLSQVFPNNLVGI